MTKESIPYIDISTNQSLQPNKYNGKELDLMHGLNTYDYGARQYDPITITWNGVDALAEKNTDTSPFSFCHNNPVNRIDPDGRDDYYTQDGRFLMTDDKETDHIIIRDEFAYKMNQEGLKWVKYDTPIEKTTLTAEAYSKIFTNILGRMSGVDINELLDNHVSVTVWNDDNNLYSTTNYTKNANFGSNAFAGVTKKFDKANITAYIYPELEKREMFSTISNVQNILGAHEFLGHYKRGWSMQTRTHHKVYEFQQNHPTWYKTTTNYKRSTKQIYNDIKVLER